MAGDGGVIDVEVDRAQRVNGVGDHRPHIGFAADIGAQVQGANAAAFNLAQGGRFGAIAGDGDVHAFFGQGQGA